MRDAVRKLHTFVSIPKIYVNSLKELLSPQAAGKMQYGAAFNSVQVIHNSSQIKQSESQTCAGIRLVVWIHLMWQR